MKSITEYIHLILEGGNAVTAQPIPAFIAPLLYEEIEKKVHDKSDVRLAPLGSLGKKKDDDFTGDIDIAIDIKDLEEVYELIQKVFPNNEIQMLKGLNVVSMSYPYDKEGKKGNAQIDFMSVKNFEWAKFRYNSPDYKKNESKYKAALRSALCSLIVSAIPVEDAKDEYFEDGTTVKKKWKYTFNTEGIFKQLLDYTGKNGKPVKNPKKLKEFEQLVTNDPQNFIRFIFGDKGELSDYTSAESLWKAIHDKDKFKWQDVVKEIEQRFFEEVVPNNNVDPNDFKCEFYNV